MIQCKKIKISKYIFTLKNVNTEKIDQKYGISIISNISNVEAIIKVGRIKVSDPSQSLRTPRSN